MLTIRVRATAVAGGGEAEDGRQRLSRLTRTGATHTEYASWAARTVAVSGDRETGGRATAHLAPVLLPPSEDTALAVATTHQSFDFLTI